MKTKLFASELAVGLSVFSLTFGLGAASIITVTPTSAHAQLFGDDDDKDNPTQVPTNAQGWDAKHLQQLDRDVRKLERSVARVENKESPPILIEPDPEVVALQATVDTMSRKQDDQTATLTTLTGELEQSQHENQMLIQQLSALTVRMDTLTKRADLAEAHLKDIDFAIAPPPPPPASTGDAENDFETAFNLMTSGKIDDAERAFEAFTTTWPEASQLPEAWFRIGQIHTMKADPIDAIPAYATALKGAPKASWAPEAMVKLAGALTDTNQPAKACAALSDFDRQYAKTATADSIGLARTLKAKDKCQ